MSNNYATTDWETLILHNNNYLRDIKKTYMSTDFNVEIALLTLELLETIPIQYSRD